MDKRLLILLSKCVQFGGTTEKYGKEYRRKISATQIQRKSEIPPRMLRDISKKKSDSLHNFLYYTNAGREQRMYLSYLAYNREATFRKNPKRRAQITAKVKAASRKRFALFSETGVKRIKDYCGVVSQGEMELMYG